MGSLITRGMNIPLDELLRCMDCTFRNMHDYDRIIQSLYEIHQKESETVEEYMLRVHEAVVKHTYPDLMPNEGEGLRRDHFYYELIPNLRYVLSSKWLTYLRENKQTLALTLSIIWLRDWRHATNCTACPKEEL